MNLCLMLHKKNGFTLPIHYNRLIQGAIYNNISEELADFLHNRGYVNGGRSFKLFTFSRLLGSYRLEQANKQIYFTEGARLYMSSPIQEFCTSLMGCMLGDGVIKLGEVPMEVTGISVDKPVVQGDTIVVNLISPVVAYSTFNKPGGGKYTCYFQPGEQEFSRQLENNLRKKHLAFYGQPAPEGGFSVRAVNQPRQNITMYKQTVIKGYSCRLKLSGPTELLQVAVDAGLGAKNSQGFGCLEVVQ